jgi:hypothetical protein
VKHAQRHVSVVLIAILFAALLGSVVARPVAASTVQRSAPAVAARVQANGCGFFTKAKIVLHIGAAYVLFKHWVYTPWKAGKFKKGAPGRTKTIIKGVLAALVGVHELHVALTQAKQCGAASKMQGAVNSMTGNLNKLKGGAATASTSAVNSNVSGLTKAWSTINALKGGL